MTNATLQASQAGSSVAPLRAKWGWILALGVVYVIAGRLAASSWRRWRAFSLSAS